MIFAISGVITQTDSTTVVVETNSGVSYELFVSSFDLNTVQVEQQHKFFVQEIIREDCYHLYGFLSESTKKVFNELIKINGIGPKVAITILSQLSINELMNCVRTQSLTSLLSVKGLGKKGAEKLLLALRDKWVKWLQLMPEETPLLYPNNSPKHNQQPEYIADALEALVTLGYDRRKAEKTVAAIAQQTNDTKQIITLALKELSKVVTR